MFELKNLKQNTTYLVSCAVSNAAAISDFTSVIRITTDADNVVNADVLQGFLPAAKNTSIEGRLNMTL